MKKILLTIGLVSFCFLLGTNLFSQTLTLTPGTLNIGPVLMGESSPDGVHLFTVTGSGFNPFESIYTDSQDAHFTVSLTGVAGTYNSSTVYAADGLGAVSQTIWVKYAPTSLGFFPAQIMAYEFQTFQFYFKNVMGIGQGPEMLLEGRPSASDPWEEIVDGETTASVSQGTDFGDALVNSETVDRIFQITNTATGGFSGNLVLTGVSSSGDTDQFSVTVDPLTPIPPAGGTTTFTVHFEPTSAGVKTLNLGINNNDPDEHPYNFVLKGTGIVTLPGAPTATAATLIDNNSFYANWTIGGGGPTEGYYLDVATDILFTSFVAGFEAKDVGLVNTFNVTGLDPLTDYFFRVTAYNAGGSGSASNTETLTTAPPVPVALPATNVDAESFFANWSFITGATSYRLDVNTQADFAGTAILDDFTVFANNYYIPGLTGGTTYYYRVRSNNGNSSQNSGIVSVVTTCNAPVATEASDILDNQFQANWNAPSGGAPAFYKLDVSETSTFTTFVVGYENLTVFGTSELVTGLAQNTQYFYRCRAVNASGPSVNSNTISLYTYTSSLSSIWTGTNSTVWNDGANWDNGIPGPSTDAIIADVTNQPIISKNSVCNDLNINPEAELTVSDGFALSVNGNALLEGDITGTSSLIEYGGLSVTGSEEAQVYLSENRWHFVSSPVSSGIANIFFDIYLREWDEATSEWTYIVDENEPLTPGKGYSAWTDPALLGNTTVTYTDGSFNQGTVSLPVSISGAPGWNVVGNPYPSAIDWDDASWTKTNIDGSIYVWNGSGYLVWNGTVGSLTDGIIPAFQGFYVKASGASPELQVNDAARVHGPTPYKNSGIENLLKVTASGNSYSDATFINFNENATTGFDSQYDAHKIFGIEEAPQIYCQTEAGDLAINVLPEYYQGLVIPLGFKFGIDAEYTIRIENMSSFDLPINIIIEDLQTGDMIEMTEENEYTFNASSLDKSHSFFMHFMMLTDVEDKIAADVLNIYSNASSVYVKNIGTDLTNASIHVYNISGQKVFEDELQDIPLNRIDLNLESGYYVVKVISNNTVNSEKVFVR